MCLILFAAGAHPRFPLIVAANRDEAYARPAAPAGFWKDHPQIFGGRDLLQGGTWLGVTLDGRFAAITNYRQGQGRRDAPRSRGELTRDYLAGTQDIEDYVQEVSARASEYNGYSLIAGTPDRLFFCSNRGNGVLPIPPGVHGLSNRLLNEPWPKVQRGVSALSNLLDADEAQLEPALFDLLADARPAPDHLLPSTGIAFERERDLSASFIAGDAYGTRASTVLLMADDGTVLFCERRFGPKGALLGATKQRFRLQRGSTTSGRAAAQA